MSPDSGYKVPELLKWERETAERHIKLRASAAVRDPVDVDAAYDLSLPCLIDMGLVSLAALAAATNAVDLLRPGSPGRHGRGLGTAVLRVPGRQR